MVIHIEDLIKFSKDVRLPESEGYMNEKILQEKELDEKNRQLRNDIAALELKKSKLEGEYDLILWKSKRAEEESYFSFEQELENHGISMTDDIPNFVSTVRCIAEYGYDPLRVVKELKRHTIPSRQIKSSENRS
jgi:hypothetical protein